MKPGPACVTYRVPYADTDQMGVVYYGNYLTYFERARNELLRRVGFTYRELEARGYALPVLEARVSYRGAARYDDLLEIRGWVGWIKPVRLRIDCEVYRDDRCLAEGHTVHAFVTRDELKPTRMPEEFRRLFEAGIPPRRPECR